MSKKESKKEHILCRGLEVMKANGYNGTSVKDIVDAANVPKGSFYSYFDSKEAFAIEAIKHVAEEGYEVYRKQLRHSASPPLKRLERFFVVNTDEACSGEFKVGCFLGNMCQEMADNCELIGRTIRQAMGELTKQIEAVLVEAQADGSLPPEQDPGITAEFLLNAWEGALMRMKATKGRDPLDAFMAMLPVILSTR